MPARKTTLGNDLAWMDLAAAPADCPWHTPDDVIAAWAGVEPSAKTFVKALRSCTKHDVARTKGRWYLRYRLPKVTFVGGPPTPSPILPKHVVKAQRTLPADLLAIYAVHDGFGIEGRADAQPPAWEVVDSLCPIANLELLSAVCGRSPTGQPIEDPTALLGFLVEDAGDRLGIYKQFAGDPYKDAFRWNHETREVAKVGAVLKVLARTWSAKTTGR